MVRGAESGRRTRLIDLAVALGIPALQLGLLVGLGALPPGSRGALITISLILIQGLPLAVRRRQPVPVFGLVLAANSVYYALGLPPTGYDLGLAVALYAVARHRSIQTSAVAYAIVVAETLIMKLFAVGPYWQQAPWFLVTYLWVYFGAAWALGRYLQVRAQRSQDLLERAAQERDEAAAATVRAERTRIARELHDVIAHHLSVMVIQAGGARRLIDQDPDRAREALTIIEQYGRRGLEAMPGLLRALRNDGGPPGTEEGEQRAPAPQLADVASMITQLRQSGLAVDLTVHGESRPLPDAVELSAFRIIQESLTNVVRHAPGAAVTIELSYSEACLAIDVSDNGPGLPDLAIASGHGLAGMRERVTLLGGRWRVDRSPAGGCRIRAELPAARMKP